MSHQVLFAHARPAIGRAIAHVLRLHGYEMVLAADGERAMQRLSSRRFAAVVVDVALPGVPGYELVPRAKLLAQDRADQGAPFGILVASVYRRTSYKRRPQRLYGADDYVEVHHLGDMLPGKLDRLIGRDVRPPAELDQAERQASDALRDEGDARMEAADARSLAELIVADLVLYNGDRILAARDVAQARASVAEDLEIAREIHAQAKPQASSDGDPVGEAFDALMRVMGRAG